MSGFRRGRLFRNNRHRAIRIPVEFDLPRRDGDRLLIGPVRPKGLTALLDSWEALDEASGRGLLPLQGGLV
jgi:antitoxin VapB